MEEICGRRRRDDGGWELLVRYSSLSSQHDRFPIVTMTVVNAGGRSLIQAPPNSGGCPASLRIARVFVTGALRCWVGCYFASEAGCRGRRPCCSPFATTACLTSGVDGNEHRVVWWRGSGDSDGGGGGVGGCSAVGPASGGLACGLQGLTGAVPPNTFEGEQTVLMEMVSQACAVPAVVRRGRSASLA